MMRKSDPFYSISCLVAVTIVSLALSGFGAAHGPNDESPGLDGDPTSGLFAQAQVPSAAQSRSRQTAVVEERTFSFKELGYTEKLMVGPYSAVSMLYSVPANWQFRAGGKITLSFALAVSGHSSRISAMDANRIEGTLLVILNDQVIHTVVLDEIGDYEIEILIPEIAYPPSLPDGRHHLRLFLDASIGCDEEDLQTALLISPTSKLSLKYEVIAPVLDLFLFPRPFYQLDSILPTEAVILVPNRPTANELQAALAVAAGMGSMSDGELGLSLVRLGDVAAEVLASKHIIYVGRSDEVPEVSSLALPLPLIEGLFALSAEEAENGVIQFTLSPWSDSRAMLIVSGNSEAGIIKAAQAVSTGVIVSSGRPDLSLVEAVHPDQLMSRISEDLTLDDLGYALETMGMIGENYVSYRFAVSPEQAAASGAYFDLVSTHSRLLDYTSTGLTIYLNGEIIGSERFEDNDEQITTTRVEILPNVLRPGRNLLEIVSDLLPYYDCYSSGLPSTWLTISETSALHLPVGEAAARVGGRLDLAQYPDFLLRNQSLSELAMIVAQDDPIAWDAAARIAFHLGVRGSVPIANLEVAFADDVPEEIVTQRNLVIIGRASMLPFVAEVNDYLPAPFDSGSDVANQPVMRVNFSLPAEVSVGYIQLVPSPWIEDRLILTVSGTSEDGITYAESALIKDELSVQLKGNFALIAGARILTTDTRLGISGEGLLAELPLAATVTPSSPVGETTSPPRALEDRPQWLIPFLIISAVLMALVIAYLIISYRRRVWIPPRDGGGNDQGARR